MSSASGAIERCPQRLVVSLVDRNLLVVDTIPGCIRGLGVARIYIADIASESARITSGNHLYLKVSTASGWNLDRSGLCVSRGPVPHTVTTEDGKGGDCVVVAELNDSRLDLIVVQDSVALRPHESPIVAKYSRLSVSWKS